MTSKKDGAATELASPATGVAAGVSQPPPEVAELLEQVEQLLSAEQASKALELIAGARPRSAWHNHALGVCQLRLNNPKVAVDIFRGLVLGTAGLTLLPEAPTVFKTNYATALLMAGNVAGGVRVLHEIHAEQHPAVQKLRAAVRQWEKSLTFWQRLNWWLGGELEQPLLPDFPPGDLQ